MNKRDQQLIDQGLARYDHGILVPIIRGGSQEADPPFPEIPEDFAALDDDALAAFAEETAQALAQVGADPAAFVSEAVPADVLLAAMEASVEALEQARDALAVRAEAEPIAPEAEVEVDADAFAALAARAELSEESEAPEPEPEAPAEEPEAPAEEPEEAPAVEELAVEPVVAAAVPARRPAPPRPRGAHRAATATPAVSLVAAGGSGLPDGAEFTDPVEIADAMVKRRGLFGQIGEGTSDRVSIARADWSHLYGPERTLGLNEIHNQALVSAVVNDRDIKAEMRRRRDGKTDDALVASGGLCAPVTPYYQLQVIATAGRPVRAAFPSFNADRGGIRYARPASLASVTTGVGSITAANDQAGGTFATKTCQVIACPAFTETDVAAIYHCLQFGNLGARTFPELVAQWNELTLAAQARLADSLLLTAIDAASTQVTAQSLGIGAAGSLLGQILAAANAMRSRHRMDPEAVLRLMIPEWAIDMMVSDVIRSTFQRFETDEDRITALLRSFDIEPTFYIDGAAGRAQVFGTQAAGALLPFPSTVVWYLFPEGSFLFIDGGVLELGLVRDSVLNKTNDFQIFGETFENIAFVGLESLAVASAVCDSGITAGTHNTICPINYTLAS